MEILGAVWSMRQLTVAPPAFPRSSRRWTVMVCHPAARWVKDAEPFEQSTGTRSPTVQVTAPFVISVGANRNDAVDDRVFGAG
jgi:hypothetical protein